MSGPIYYGAELVRRVLTWQLVNEAVEEALKAVAAQSRNAPQLPYVVSQPMRSVTIAGTERSQLLFTMPAYVGNYRLSAAGASGDAGNATRSTLACKLVTSFRSNQELQPPLPSIAANILLFNAGTGELDAIMSGTDITTWRTAAASVVATKYLYFGRFNAAISELPIKVAIIGCGTQGEIHAVAMCANFKVEQLLLYNRTATRAQQLADKLCNMTNLQHTPEIVVCNSAREAVRDANVICVATFSREPLFNACDLGSKRGLHINAVGAGEVAFGEVATDVYQQSEVFVDSLANAEHELNGFPVSIAGEVGGVINKDYKPEPTSMTLFQSMGMASEDACVAEAVRSALLTIDSSPHLIFILNALDFAYMEATLTHETFQLALQIGVLLFECILSQFEHLIVLRLPLSKLAKPSLPKYPVLPGPTVVNGSPFSDNCEDSFKLEFSCSCCC